MNGTVAIAKGAAVTGEVVAPKKGILGRGAKAMFKLETADAVDGTKLKVKAVPGRNDRNERTLEFPGKRPTKEKLAAAGSLTLGYFDGDQTVAVKK